MNAIESRRLRLNWLVPEPMAGAGGDTGIHRIIRYLADFGHNSEVHVVPYGRMDDWDDDAIADYVREHFGPTSAHYQKWNGTLPEADAHIATFWPTAEILLSQLNDGQRYYLVQDFEPAFYPDDAHHSERAERTYRAGLHCITLGPCLASFLRERSNAEADHFDFAVDTKIYFPRETEPSAAKRVCFYARPSTPRRGYDLGLEALTLLKARMPEAEITFFGAAELDPLPSFPFVNRGLLSPEELAQVFSSSDVGLVLSLSNPSFVPLEMMACGCAVVELASDRMEGVLAHGEDSWLVEQNPEAIANGISLLLTDTDLRERIVSRGLERTRAMSWENSARQIEQILLEGYDAPPKSEAPRALIQQLPSQKFRPRIYGVGAWTNHLHFAYDAVTLLRPTLLVELGVDRGESYFCFCQAIAETNLYTQAIAVDTWVGDPHAGDYDETTYREVSAHNARYYSAFSTLLRTTFAQACGHFVDESIDLLHIDGLHTEEALRRDLDEWLPKLGPGGILLLHDVNERRRDFGVWKVWEELRRTGRSFSLDQGPGLGVWQKPPHRPLPRTLESMFEGDGLSYALFAHYRRAAGKLQEQITRQWQDGTIRETAHGQQTVVQIFYSDHGVHTEENSMLARIGHGDWKTLHFDFPPNAGAAPLRIDFVSTFHSIEIARLVLSENDNALLSAEQPAEFASLRVGGDAEPVAHSEHFCIRVTGIDPQLYLPEFAVEPDARLRLELKLRVLA